MQIMTLGNAPIDYVTSYRIIGWCTTHVTLSLTLLLLHMDLRVLHACHRTSSCARVVIQSAAATSSQLFMWPILRARSDTIEAVQPHFLKGCQCNANLRSSRACNPLPAPYTAGTVQDLVTPAWLRAFVQVLSTVAALEVETQHFFHFWSGDFHSYSELAFFVNFSLVCCCSICEL